MLPITLSPDNQKPVTVLCLGAHSDDIEIGCGGTLIQLQEKYRGVQFHWVVFCAGGQRQQEAEKACGLFVPERKNNLVLKQFRDGFLPYSGSEVKEYFEEMKGQVKPDLIFTHWGGDAHQDHRMISELTWNTFRNHLILEYEIPKYDGDMGRPNVFIPLRLATYERKLDYLFEAFDSQKSKPWFAPETFLGLMRLRGMESNACSGYAEAFYSRKILISL